MATIDSGIAIGGNRASPSADYLELARIVRRRGLLEKQPRYYALDAVVTLGLLVLGFIFLALVDSLWLVILDAVFLSVVFARIGFLGHDAGHRQIFRSNRSNDIVGLGVSFLLGMERTWWVDKHNRHHSNPNQTGMDPDIDIPVLAFSEEEALEKGGFYRLIVRYQHLFFFPLLALEGGFGLRLAGIQYLMHNRVKYPVIEPLLFAGHFVAYLGLLFWLLNPVARGPVYRGTPTAVRLAHGLGLRPEPQRDADTGRRQSNGLPATAGADGAQHPAESRGRLHVRRPQLPDRAPPVPQHAPQQAGTSPGGGAGVLPGPGESRTMRPGYGGPRRKY